MDLRQLEYFVAVAEEHSFTRGANRTYVVQSAVSAAIIRLEREVGAILFDRSGSRIELTDAGRLLLNRARNIISELQGARDDLDALAGELHGSVVVGTVLSTGTLDLVAALTDFHRSYPHVFVKLRLSAGPLEDRVNELLEGRVDLLLLPIPAGHPQRVRIDQLGHLQMALACHHQDPLARQREVTYRDLSDRLFVDFPSNWGNRAIIDGLFADHGVQRRVGFEVADVAAALRLVGARLGIAYVPTEFIDDVADVTRVDLRDPPPAVDLGLGIHLDRTPSVAAEALRRSILLHGVPPS